MKVRIVRSCRRRKTAEAKLLRDGTVEVRVPAHLSEAQAAEVADRLGKRLKLRNQQVELNQDGSLERRAQELIRHYFQGNLPLKSITYTTRQKRLFGSCSPTQGVIRISHRVAGLPQWVKDYVIMHELAHLVESNHSPRFWSLVKRYPKAERARGYLMALGLESDADGDPPSDLE